MDDRSAPRPAEPRRPDRIADDADATGTSDPDVDSPVTPIGDRIDLAGLSIAGITRRRVGWVAAAFVAAWIVIVFARQVGEAQTAASHAVQLADDNTALAAEVQALQNELDLIVHPDYVAVRARAFRFGSSKEIPFTLDPSVPDPVDGAPGSASVRLGAKTEHQTPLESWLSLLFGPGG